MEKVAIVTGAARGIGARIAIRLAEEGFSIALLDLNEAQCQETLDVIEQRGVRAVAVAVDVTNEESVGNAVKEVASRLGSPVVLVNNAGLMKNRVSHKMSLAEWDAVMDVNLKGTFLMCREVLPYMRSAKWGRIINISSTAALGLLGGANYASAKAGIQGLTKTLAIEFGRSNITANTIAPGFVVTEMTRATAEQVGITIEQMEENEIKSIPVGRSGTPDDIAHATAFFADERSGFVSGQVLYVAGGPKT